MAKSYDVIIVGGGPAGIFTALELSRASELDILLLEKGKALNSRHCPSIDNRINCISCSPCDMVSGWGGAGAFSDGKLTLSPDLGGQIQSYLGEQKTKGLINYVDNRYLEFGAPDKLYGIGIEVEELKRRAILAGLNLISAPIRHLGTERCREVLKRMHHFLSSRVEMRTRAEASSILTQAGEVKGIETQDGQKLEARYLVIAPGREGADWLIKEASRLGLTKHNKPVDIGVRLEVPQEVLEDLTNVLYEPKLEFYSRTFQDRFRTFCMCPAGEVIMESTGGCDPVLTVNGHSYAHHKTNNTNFALLGSVNFARPFQEPIAYGRYLARLANLISGGIILQRLGDLREGRCSSPPLIERGTVKPTLKSAYPGDIASVLPYRLLKGIEEMLGMMDKLTPGVASTDALLYGVEVKFYSSRLQLTEKLETEIANMFAIGDGAGITRGLVQASASGVVAAREILRRIGKGVPS